MNRAPKELVDQLMTPDSRADQLPVDDSTSDPSLGKLKEIDLRTHLTRFEGLEFNAQGACFCPVHAENEPSFKVSRHTDGHWYWFDWHNQGREGFSGTIIDYYVIIKGMDIGAAIRSIKDREGIDDSDEGPLSGTLMPAAAPSGPASGSTERVVEAIFRQLSSVVSRQTFYLMQDRIPMGMFSLIVGCGGAGKSTLLTELASRVSQGEPLPGAEQALVPRGSTIYVTTENQPEEVFRPRAIACRGDLSKIYHVRNVLARGGNRPGEIQILDIGRHLPALEKLLDQVGDVRQVVIDPLISHISEKIDDGRAKPVRQLLDTLSEFAERKKIAIIGAGHVAKGVASSAAAKVAGSHQWIDASRVALGVAKDREDPDGRRRFLSTLKSNIYVTWKTLVFNIVDTIVQDEAAPGLSFRAGRVEFEEEEIDIDVESIFNPDRVMESMTTKAIRLLNNELKSGPRPAEEISALAEAQGITEGALKYARRKRGIHAEKLGGRFGSESGEEKWVLWLSEHWDAYQSGRRSK